MIAKFNSGQNCRPRLNPLKCHLSFRLCKDQPSKCVLIQCLRTDDRNYETIPLVLQKNKKILKTTKLTSIHLKIHIQEVFYIKLQFQSQIVGQKITIYALLYVKKKELAKT